MGIILLIKRATINLKALHTLFYTEMAEKESIWPKIPEIPVNFRSRVNGFNKLRGIIAKVDIDLGILGVHSCDFQIDEPDPALESEMIEEAKIATQQSFGDILLKYAAVVLVNRREGLNPMAIRYEAALEELREGIR